ncbi:MAG: dihydroorotate dehydrogenase [Candidatus Bathyarchaeota archaeon]
MNKNRLCVNIAGLRLDNPTMLASGVLGLSAELMSVAVTGGAGAVVSKSIGPEPRNGFANPTVVQTDYGLINAIGLPNPGIDHFAEEIPLVSKLGVPVIVSVYGFSVDDYVVVTKKAVEGGADAVELNVSCPHVKCTGSEIGQDPMLLEEIVKAVKNGIDRPVFVKLSPNVTNIIEIAEVAADAGADALTAINTLRATAIDIETTRPILSNRIGGLSGPAIKPVAIRCVYEIYEKVRVPIIGCGGLVYWKDAVEFLLAGARAVQIGTALMIQDGNVFKTVTEGVEAYLRRKGFKNVKDIVGLAHKK